MPTVTSVSLDADGTQYDLTGTDLTGFSEGAAYGDDAEMSTNFPVVKLTLQTGGSGPATVYYVSTTNWVPGVADGGSQTIRFTPPPDFAGRHVYGDGIGERHLVNARFLFHNGLRRCMPTAVGPA